MYTAFTQASTISTKQPAKPAYSSKRWCMTRRVCLFSKISQNQSEYGMNDSAKVSLARLKFELNRNCRALLNSSPDEHPIICDCPFRKKTPPGKSATRLFFVSFLKEWCVPLYKPGWKMRPLSLSNRSSVFRRSTFSQLVAKPHPR